MSQSPQTLKILIVEDDADFRRQTVQSLLPYNDVFEAATLADARAAIARSSFDVVVLDKKLPDGEANLIIPEITSKHPNCAILILTGDADQALVHRYMKLGVHDYVQKTENAVLDLKIRIPTALATITLQRKSEALEARVAASCRHEIVGKSDATRKLRERILSLKGSRFPILISGESGTGKEGIAQMLHRIEGPSARPLVIVNCGAIPENLIESELFGHLRGSFTGAHRDQPGKFEMAHMGDLFLDEIAELPPSAQVKLLRVLQEGEVSRVGETTRRQVSVRIITATNRDLHQLVLEEKFRQDLYYRINVIPIQTTPLRDRLDDIPDIAQFLLAVVGKGRFTIDARVMDVFNTYLWPGNVRELGNVIERGMIEAKIRGSKHLEQRDFSFLQEDASRAGPGRAGLPSRSSDVSLTGLEDFLKQAERDYLARALTHFDGSVTALAQQMNYSRSTLFRRLANLGLNGQRPGLTTSPRKEHENEKTARH